MKKVFTVFMQYSRFTVRRKDMTDIRKKILKKINQGGSMMVEAMAMLALIALVTPTLYKKSAERTTELQDINTASHVRTLSKAVDNYVGTNYQALLDPTNGLLPADGSTANITLAALAPYLPYGYSFDELKNFGTPTVSVRRTADSVTAFVQLPKKTDIGEMRAARIASMIGSNGGYVTADKKALGVGGVWSLDEAGLNALGFSKDLGSVVVASSEAINSATSGALENEKYLQRTPVPEGEEWRNTMTTDLYMGGHGTGETSDMHNILGVQKMIVGATEDTLTGDDADNPSYGLVLAKSKSAWVDGNLEALQGFFGVIGNDDGAGNISGETLFFGNEGAEIISATNEDVSFFVNNGEEGADAAVSFADDVANVNVDTYVATQEGNVFAAGPEDARYIYAESNQVKLLPGAGYTTRTNGSRGDVLTAVGNEGSSKAYVQADSELHVIDETYLMGKTTIDPDGKTASGVISTLLTNENFSRMLDVKGNALITGTLEATNRVASGNMDAGILRAGAQLEGNASYTSDVDWWLRVDANGIVSREKNNNGQIGKTRMMINDTITELYGVEGDLAYRPALILDSSDAQLRGRERVDIYTSDEIYDDTTQKATVNLQNGAVLVAGKYNNNPSGWSNKVTVNAYETDINSSIAHVDVSNYFQVNADGGSTKVLEVKSSTTGSGEDVPLTIDEEKLQASVIGANGPLVMEVDYSSDPHSNLVTATDTVTNNTNNASVYIRRGAISLESQIAGKGDRTYDADDGVGYVEASRFVSNSVDSNGDVVEPVYALDYAIGTYYGDSNGARADYNSGKAAGTGYDRYMVNPAYTSVMHDIKLTSRGGARLSDILPDFINKGIYVVTNTYRDNINIEQIEPDISKGGGDQVIAKGVTDVVETSGGDLQGSDGWASPFLGIVPAPQCPPGHAKLMTLTPAGFQMAQATSNFDEATAYNPHINPVDETTRLVILPGGGNVEQIGNENGSNTAKNYAIATTKSETIPELSKTIYYLGYDEGDNAGKEHPKPLYFQQSTWLRSKVIPQEYGYVGNRNFIGGDEKSPRPPADVAANAHLFVGWSAITGFVYPANHYTSVIARVLGDSPQNVDQDRYYWNVFPVQTGTIEAYATVYCYFDRTNIFDSGNDGKYVDQYDQLNNFRQGYHKSGNVMDNSSSGSGPGVNTDYLNRLDDPTLKYDDPW